MTPLESLRWRLERRGYHVFELRQPIPSTREPGVIFFCVKQALDPGYNGKRSLGLLTLTEADLRVLRKRHRVGDAYLTRKIDDAEAAL